MAKKSKTKTNAKRDRLRNREERKPTARFAEDRRSLAVTVAWTMATLATLGALTLCAIAFLLFGRTSVLAGRPSPLAMLPGLLLWIAMITGSASVGLIPLVYRFRQSHPPLSFTLGSIVIGGAPWFVLLAQIVFPVE